MDNFIYDTPTRVYFGKEQEKKVGEILAEYGAKKVLIHYGGGSAVRSGLIGLVEECLKAQGIEYVLLGGVQPIRRSRWSAGEWSFALGRAWTLFSPWAAVP